MQWPPDNLWSALLATLLFGLVGIVLALLGFKMFDWITPRIDVERELAEKNNIAVAIVVGAVIVGICFIVSRVVS